MGNDYMISGINIGQFDLRHIRSLLGMTQYELANFLFTSVRTVQNWEYRKKCPISVYSMLWRYYFMKKELEDLKNQILGQMWLPP